MSPHPACDPTAHATPPTARPVELFATVALALSTLVAVTAVSIGIARADTLDTTLAADAAPLALFIGLLLMAMGGGLTAIMAAHSRARR